MTSPGKRALLTSLAGVAGGVALYRWLTRSQPLPQASSSPGDPVVDPRAEALRARLEEPAPVDAAADEGVAEGETSVEERRQQVHAEAKSTVRAMRRTAGDP